MKKVYTLVELWLGAIKVHKVYTKLDDKTISAMREIVRSKEVGDQVPQSEVDKYFVTVSLAEDEICLWDDGTTEYWILPSVLEEEETEEDDPQLGTVKFIKVIWSGDHADEELPDTVEIPGYVSEEDTAIYIEDIYGVAVSDWERI